MKHPFRRSRISPISRVSALGPGLMLALLLSACASKAPSPMLYDFGPLPALPARAQDGSESSAPTPPLVLFDLTGPAWLENQKMAYRLVYAEPQQTRFYAYSQWNATPLQLLGARLKSRFAQAGVAVLPDLASAANACMLRMEVDEFSQQFDTPERSSGHLALRASLFLQHRLIAQKNFASTTNANSGDAIGGAKALAAAADAIASELISWIKSVPAAP